MFFETRCISNSRKFQKPALEHFQNFTQFYYFILLKVSSHISNDMYLADVTGGLRTLNSDLKLDGQEGSNMMLSVGQVVVASCFVM